jgi:hypothetical protein
MTGVRDLPGDQPIVGYFPGHATAGTAKEVAIGRAPFRGVITAVEFIPSAGVTGANTNYFTLNVRNRTTGAGTVIPATLAFVSGTDAVAQTPKTITLSGTAANLAVAEGDVITVEKAVTGTGLACPDGEVVVHFQGA